MKKLAQFSLLFSIPLVTVTFSSASAQAFTVVPVWDVQFEEGITGSGQITLDLEDKTNDGFRVEKLNFTIDFGDSNGKQMISLSNFFTSDLRFNPDDTDKELTALNGLQSGWNQGIPPKGGVFSLNGLPGTNFPLADPPNVGGAINFLNFSDPNNLQTRAGIWHAKPVPEPSTVFGSALALGLDCFFRRQVQKKFDSTSD